MAAKTTDTAAKVDHANFTIERKFKASPAKVFHAWSDKQARLRWFINGEGFKKQDDYSHDFKVGGHESSRFSPEKAQGPIKASDIFGNDTWYLDIVPNGRPEGSRIVFAYNMSLNGKTFSSSLATVEIHADGAGSRLVYTEQGAFFDGADGAEMRKGGWESLLTALEKELAR